MAKPQNNICDLKKRYKANAYVIIFNTIIFYKLSKKPSYMSSNKTIILPFCVLCYKLATIRQRVSQNFKIFPISFDKPKKEVYYVSVTNTMQGRVIMTLYKEAEIFHPLYVAKLENGVTLEVYGDSAKGSDGKTYYHVGKEDEQGDMYTVGWSFDIDEAVILKSE